MSIKCLMNGLEVNYPCSPACALFGDCVTAYETQKKANVRTRADRIRAEVATDEGLAKFLMKAHDGEIHIPFCQNKVACGGEDDPYGEGCMACMAVWLQQQAEGGSYETEKSD